MNTERTLKRRYFKNDTAKWERQHVVGLHMCSSKMRPVNNMVWGWVCFPMLLTAPLSLVPRVTAYIFCDLHFPPQGHFGVAELLPIFSAMDQDFDFPDCTGLLPETISFEGKQEDILVNKGKFVTSQAEFLNTQIEFHNLAFCHCVHMYVWHVWNWIIQLRYTVIP